MVKEKLNSSDDASLLEVQTELFEEVGELVKKIIGFEEYALANRCPPQARQYRIRFNKKKYIIAVPSRTELDLLTLEGKLPPSGHMITQKFRGGQAKEIRIDGHGFDRTRHWTLPALAVTIAFGGCVRS
jgi:hypothetical protein